MKDSNSSTSIGPKEPPEAQLRRLLSIYQDGELIEAERLAIALGRTYPDHPFAMKVLAAVLVQTGRKSEAVDVTRKVVALAPLDPDAHSNLGNTLKQVGRYEEAEVSYVKAIALKPDYSEAHYNFGVMLKDLGRLDEAKMRYKQAIALKPDYAEAHYNLGIILYGLNSLDEAEASFANAIFAKPSYVEAHRNLGATLQKLGRLEEAEASYNQAIELKPDHTEALYNLGLTLNELERLDEAEACYKKAIAFKPDYAEAHNNLGLTLHQKGRLDEAIASYLKAIAFKSTLFEAHFNLGATLQELGRLDEAKAYYTQAITLKSNYPEALNNLGITLKDMGKFDEAESGFRRAIELKPDYAEAHSNLGNALREQGELDDAETNYRRAIELKPDYAAAQSNLLFLNSSMRFDESGNRKDLKDFADIVAERISSPYSAWSCGKSSTKLRVGFVSGDFKQHPVGYFLEGLLVQLQSYSIELYAYPTNNPYGEITDRLKGLFHAWRSIVGRSDRDAARIIHDDGIHILIDLSGHTASNRLSVFGLKPAPVQITWLGYFASTGLPEIDFILGDPFVTPQSEAQHFTEKIWQMPETFLCFTPPNQGLSVGPLPARRNGYVTFGCFNNLSKMTDEVVSIRANILHAVPDSKLFLKDKRFEYQSDRDRVLSRFAVHGIFSDRLLLEGSSSREDYLRCYHRVDIALSPFPYGGGTTSAEGLWMGVPVITRKGSYFLSHLGESMAHNTNLSDWIAIDNEDYVAKAIEFSSDLSVLEMLRQTLRKKLLESPLYNLPRFAKNFEKALVEMRELIDH